MEDKRAVELLVQEVDKIPYLKTLPYDNDEFQLWLKTVENILNAGFEHEDKQKYLSVSNAIPYIRWEEKDKQQDYVDKIIGYEIALRTIIKKYETLGLVTDSDTERQNDEMDKQTDESLESSKFINWKDIEIEFGVTKTAFGKKMNFVKDAFRRRIIFRDVEDAFVLASSGFPKPAVVLAGGVIEELLRLYLECRGIAPTKDSFDGYIQACEQNGLLRDSISRLSHSVRQFRNLVHLSAEETKKYTISKSAAKGAVASIFTIANDF